MMSDHHIFTLKNRSWCLKLPKRIIHLSCNLGGCVYVCEPVCIPTHKLTQLVLLEIQTGFNPMNESSSTKTNQCLRFDTRTDRTETALKPTHCETPRLHTDSSPPTALTAACSKIVWQHSVNIMLKEGHGGQWRCRFPLFPLWDVYNVEPTVSYLERNCGWNCKSQESNEKCYNNQVQGQTKTENDKSVLKRLDTTAQTLMLLGEHLSVMFHCSRC